MQTEAKIVRMANPNLIIFANRLRQTRKQRHFTQKELSEKIQIDQRQIARYEAAESEPTMTALRRIADALSVTSDYLMGRSDNPMGALDVSNLSSTEQRLITALVSGLPIDALEAAIAHLKQVTMTNKE